MIDEIEKLEAIAKKSPDEPGAWPFYMASFNKLATPTAVLALIDRLKKAEAERDEVCQQLEWSGGAPVDWANIPLPGDWAAAWPPLQQMSYTQGYREAIAAMLEQKPIGYISYGMQIQLAEEMGVSGYVSYGNTSEFPVAIYASPIAAPVPAQQEPIKTVHVEDLGPYGKKIVTRYKLATQPKAEISEDRIHEIMSKHVNCSYEEGMAFARAILAEASKGE